MFKPKIQAVDNWGFCNGTCPGDGYADDGLADGDKCFETECDDANSTGPWSEFPGVVVVAP